MWEKDSLITHKGLTVGGAGMTRGGSSEVLEKKEEEDEVKTLNTFWKFL